MVKKVLVFGSFDVVHPGHMDFFKQAKEHGDYLTVVVARNKTIIDVKGAEPKYDENERLEHVRALSCVDEAVIGSENDVYEVVGKVKPDVICLGYDQTAFTDELWDKLAKIGLDVEIMRMDAYKPEIYKSSKIKLN